MEYQKPHCAPGESDSAVMLARMIIVFVVAVLLGAAVLFL